MQDYGCGSTGSIAKELLFHIQNGLQQHGQTTAHSAQSKVTAEWDVMAGDWDDIARSYRDSFVKFFWEETGCTTKDQQKDLVVVDFGCGTGLLTDFIRKRVQQVVGLDAAPGMICVLQDKIKAGEWSNVKAYCVVAANLDASPAAKGFGSTQWQSRYSGGFVRSQLYSRGRYGRNNDKVGKLVEARERKVDSFRLASWRRAHQWVFRGKVKKSL
jgi:SAM-dependent methyltransferase